MGLYIVKSLARRAEADSAFECHHVRFVEWCTVAAHTTKVILT
jgi:hypothetical protein